MEYVKQKNQKTSRSMKKILVLITLFAVLFLVIVVWILISTHGMLPNEKMTKLIIYGLYDFALITLLTLILSGIYLNQGTK